MAAKNKSVVKIDFQILSLKSLVETTGNPQRMSQDVFNGIVKSMKKDGWILDAPVVWHRPDKKYQILSGHHRVRAAIEAGIIETGCKIIEGITEEKALLKVLEANQRRGKFDDYELNSFIENLIDTHDLDRDLILDEIGIEIDNIISPPKKSKNENENKSGEVLEFTICPACGHEF